MSKTARGRLEVVYTPLNDPQKRLREAWPQAKRVILIGPAGTGKTAAAVGEAMLDLARGPAAERADKVILSRPMVQTGRALGFTPGDFTEKLLPWLGPVADVLGDMTHETLESLKELVELVPTELLRGRTVKRKTLIIDESQNLTAGQIEMALTRVGDRGRVVLCGDPQQHDLGDDQLVDGKCPLLVAARRVAKVERVAVVVFKDKDQMRDPQVAQVLKALRGGR